MGSKEEGSFHIDPFTCIAETELKAMGIARDGVRREGTVERSFLTRAGSTFKCVVLPHVSAPKGEW